MDNIIDFAALEQRLGRVFTDRSLLERAITHGSFTNESRQRTADYQRLEFLGDAVLDLVVAEELWRQHPEAQEGRLTKARASLVNEVRLAAAARTLDLGPFLRLGAGEEAAGGRQRDCILADAVEALIAAFYLEAGLEAARQFIRLVLGADLTLGLDALCEPDPRSRLQELTQARGWGTPVYEILESTGTGNSCHFKVTVACPERFCLEAEGPSKKEAARAAARLALAFLEEA